MQRIEFIILIHIRNLVCSNHRSHYNIEQRTATYNGLFMHVNLLSSKPYRRHSDFVMPRHPCWNLDQLDGSCSWYQVQSGRWSFLVRGLQLHCVRFAQPFLLMHRSWLPHHLSFYPWVGGKGFHNLWCGNVSIVQGVIHPPMARSHWISRVQATCPSDTSVGSHSKLWR